mmetsp:Transcript_41434/g.119901  ORF Transcript_41434/g.119901 Transcript_41434/m.119901 type:complete len:202 (+) Transcript_41434:245-850(+)
MSDHIDATRHVHSLHMVAVEAVQAPILQHPSQSHLSRFNIEGEHLQAGIKALQSKPVDCVPGDHRPQRRQAPRAAAGLLPAKELLAAARLGVRAPDAYATGAGLYEVGLSLASHDRPTRATERHVSWLRGQCLPGPMHLVEAPQHAPGGDRDDAICAGQQSSGAAPGLLPRPAELAPAPSREVKLQDGRVLEPDEEPEWQP